MNTSSELKEEQRTRRSVLKFPTTGSILLTRTLQKRRKCILFVAETIRPCDFDAPQGECIQTRATSLLNRFNYRMAAFGFGYYWLSWLFILVSGEVYSDDLDQVLWSSRRWIGRCGPHGVVGDDWWLTSDNWLWFARFQVSVGGYFVFQFKSRTSVAGQRDEEEEDLMEWERTQCSWTLCSYHDNSVWFICFASHG